MNLWKLKVNYWKTNKDKQIKTSIIMMDVFILLLFNGLLNNDKNQITDKLLSSLIKFYLIKFYHLIIEIKPVQ
ncbi:hypothetical protein D3C81_603930 [compost metagenome]